MVFANRFLISFLCLLAVLASYVSCTKDRCKEVFCQNGGVCIDGDCDCPDWHEEEDCSIAMRDKFLSDFATVVNFACDSGNVNIAEITPGEEANEFQIVGFINEPLNAALTTSTHFVVPSQNFYGDSLTVSGYGDYQNIPENDFSIVFNYTVVRNWLANDTLTCVSLIHK